tara:strand:+ start:1042 stop:1326 length:285 start_codon:yes stop_codon:yes gene_type:complete
MGGVEMNIIKDVDFKDLTLLDLFESEDVTQKQIHLILRSLEGKVLDIPNKLKELNPNCDFNSGRIEEVMVDLNSYCDEVYHILSMLRECLPEHG